MDYHLLPSPDLRIFLSNLPEGVRQVPLPEHYGNCFDYTWTNEAGDGMFRATIVGPSYSESGQCFLHVVGRNGRLVCLEAYNLNQPLRLLELLQEKFQCRVQNEWGLELGEVGFA